MKISLSGKSYYTDENGEAIITAPTAPGSYSLKISQDRDDNYPLIVRTTKDFDVIEAIQFDTIQLAREHLAKSLAYIHETTPNPTFGTGGGEWSILALARGGYAVSEGYDIYYNNVVNEVKRLMPASESKPEGRLDRNKGTEHSRLIIGLTSIGKDITDVGAMI